MDKLGIKYGGPVRKKLALLQYSESQARHLRDAIYPTSHLNLLRSKSTISYNAENFSPVQSKEILKAIGQSWLYIALLFLYPYLLCFRIVSKCVYSRREKRVGGVY